MHYLDRSGHVSAVPSRPRETCFNSDLAVHAAITQYIGHYIQLVNLKPYMLTVRDLCMCQHRKLIMSKEKIFKHTLKKEFKALR